MALLIASLARSATMPPPTPSETMAGTPIKTQAGSATVAILGLTRCCNNTHDANHN